MQLPAGALTAGVTQKRQEPQVSPLAISGIHSVAKAFFGGVSLGNMNSGRKPKPRPVPDLQDVDDDEIATDPDKQDEVSTINAVLGAQPGGGIKINVYRKREASAGPTYAYVCSIDPAQADNLLDEVSNRAGNGQYRIRLCRRDGTIAKTIDICIEGARPPATQQAIVAAAPASSIERRFEEFIAMSAKNQELLVQAITARNSNALDPLDTIERVAKLMGPIRGEPAAPSDGGKTIFDAVMAGIAFAKDTMGTGIADRATGLWDVIKAGIENPGLIDGIKGFLEAVQSRQPQSGMNGHAPARPALARPAMAPGPPIPEPAPMPAPERSPSPAPAAAEPVAVADQFNQIIGSFLPFLVAKAAANSSPGLYAEMLLDQSNIPAEFSHLLVTTPGVLDTLAVNFPAIAQHRDWFDALLAEMKQQVEDADKPDDDNNEPAGVKNGPIAAGGEARANP